MVPSCARQSSRSPHFTCDAPHIPSLRAFPSQTDEGIGKSRTPALHSISRSAQGIFVQRGRVLCRPHLAKKNNELHQVRRVMVAHGLTPSVGVARWPSVARPDLPRFGQGGGRRRSRKTRGCCHGHRSLMISTLTVFLVTRFAPEAKKISPGIKGPAYGAKITAMISRVALKSRAVLIAALVVNFGFAQFPFEAIASNWGRRRVSNQYRS